MRTLLLTALLLATPGAPRAAGAPAHGARPPEPGAPAAALAKEAKGERAKTRKAGKKAAVRPPPKDAAPAAAPTPCEPVKPCPID